MGIHNISQKRYSAEFARPERAFGPYLPVATAWCVSQAVGALRRVPLVAAARAVLNRRSSPSTEDAQGLSNGAMVEITVPRFSSANGVDVSRVVHFGGTEGRQVAWLPPSGGSARVAGLIFRLKPEATKSNTSVNTERVHGRPARFHPPTAGRTLRVAASTAREYRARR